MNILYGTERFQRNTKNKQENLWNGLIIARKNKIQSGHQEKDVLIFLKGIDKAMKMCYT